MDISESQKKEIYQLIRECGQQGKKLAESVFEVSQKGPNDYVTSVDRSLDRLLTSGFTRLFPEDGIITEENEKSRSQYWENYPRLWCIDPIDGTTDFIDGSTSYSVMVGLLRNNQPIAGWIYAPVFDQMYYGGQDWGLFQTIGDGEPQPFAVIPPPPPNPENCTIVLGDKDQKNYGNAIGQYIPGAQYYSLGSFGLKVLEIIQGRAGLYLYFNGRVKVWDTVGPLAIAQTAGLVCCDLDGNPIQWTSDTLDINSLTHKQPVVIGWPEYIQQYREKIRQAVLQQRQVLNLH
jgi:3'(2'), 5'-bisphosphate nucleotidase